MFLLVRHGCLSLVRVVVGSASVGKTGRKQKQPADDTFRQIRSHLFTNQKKVDADEKTQEKSARKKTTKRKTTQTQKTKQSKNAKRKKGQHELPEIKSNKKRKSFTNKHKTYTTGSLSRLRPSTICMFRVQSGEMSKSLQAFSTSFIKASAGPYTEKTYNKKFGTGIWCTRD